jgi:carboxypeptidase A4
LNRNYQIGWGGEGSSPNPSSDVYHGPTPFSEPELQHLRSYSLSLRGVTGFIDWHSYAEKILYPWSYTTAPSPAGSWHQNVGEQMRDSMVAAGGHAYLVGQGSIALYVAGGTSKDWFYSSYGATSFTIELRDTGQNGFLLPESQITPTQNEAWAGFAKFLKLLL